MAATSRDSGGRVCIRSTTRNAPALHLRRQLLGNLRIAQWPHMNLLLEGARVLADHLIGTEGKGVPQAVTTLDHSRTLAAAISIGIARAAFDSAFERVAGRVALDQKVLGFQGLQWYLADMLADIDAARLLVYHAAKAPDTHDDIDRDASEAKLKAAEMATRVASTHTAPWSMHRSNATSVMRRPMR